MTGFRGVYPMLYAFFDASGGLDREAMRRQVEFCVASGAHGIAVLGLGTEVGKLAPQERLDVLRWAAADLAGRLPLAVTVFGATPGAQIAFVEAAAAHGADWLILQPPPAGEISGEEELIAFFGTVADASPLPVAIQNAPQYIGTGLSNEGIARLTATHHKVTMLKAEGSAVETRALIERTQGRLDVFQGRGGLEFTDVIRAGCAGMIPSVESCVQQVRLFELLAAGEEDEAQALYARLAPLIVFLMQSVPTFICYGKRLTARQIGLDVVHDRPPSLFATTFGRASAARHARYAGLAVD